MVAVSLTTFSIAPGAFSWQKIVLFWFKSHWHLFQLTTSSHWLRWCLGAKQMTSQYLNHWWAKSLTQYVSQGLIQVNSSPPSAAYMRQETGSVLVQVMACRLTAPSHYLSQYWLNVNWTLRNKLHWYFNRHSIIFIEEFTFENVVCDFPAKLSRGRWVNCVCHLTHWGRDEIDEILQTTFSNAFSWMKMYWFRLRFHWNLFPIVQLTIFQHWFR